MSTNVGAVDFELLLNSNPFNKGLKNTTNTLKSSGIESTLGNIGKAAIAAFSVKKLVDFTKECLDLGSNLAEVQNVVDVTFGSLNKEVDEFAKNAIDQFGLSQTVTKKYVGTFGAMAKAFNFNNKAALDMSKSLTGLTGDVASFYNLSSDEAYTKLKSVFTGETETLKDLGIVMTQSALDAYALANGFGKTTSKMSEQEKTALRYQFVLDKLSLANGDFARTSDSWANQTRVLSLRFDELKASLGQGFINLFTPIIQVINTVLGKLQVLANAFKSFTEALFGNAGGDSTVSNLVTDATEASSAVSSIGDSAVSSAKKMKSLAGFDTAQILQSQSSDASSGGGGAGNISDFSNLGNRLNKVDQMTEKFKNIGEKIKLIWNSEPIQAYISACKTAGKFVSEFVIESGKIVSNHIGIVKQDISDNIKTIASNMSELYTGIFTEIERVTANVGEPIKNNMTSLLDEILTECFDPFIIKVTDIWADFSSILLELWNKYGSELSTNIGNFVLGVTESFQKVYDNVIEPIITPFLNTLSWLWDNHLSGMIKNLGEFGLEVANAALTIYNQFIKPVCSFLSDILAPAWAFITTYITGILGSLIGTVIDIASGIIRTLKGIIEFITGIFTLDFEKAWQGIKDIVGGLGDAIVGILKGAVNLVIDLLNAPISAINHLPDWVPMLGGVEIPLIPKLAQGAYVKANTPQLAMIGDNRHQGEIIAPEDKIMSLYKKANQEMELGGNNSKVIDLLQRIIYLLETLDLNFNLYIDAYELNKQLEKVKNKNKFATNGGY